MAETIPLDTQPAGLTRVVSQQVTKGRGYTDVSENLGTPLSVTIYKWTDTTVVMSFRDGGNRSLTDVGITPNTARKLAKALEAACRG